MNAEVYTKTAGSKKISAPSILAGLAMPYGPNSGASIILNAWK
ncbi:hypothetical protein [Acinetobacter pragensis]|nr:hypothetical protein [Acinetobacter pragensis]